MAYVHKREGKRGRATRYTCYYIGADGKKKSRAGTTDKGESQRIANALEAEALKIRLGQLDPAEQARREAGLKSVADHLADYRRDMAAKGDTPRHVDRTVRAIARLFSEAGVVSVAAISPSLVRSAVAGLRNAGRGGGGPASARTRNFYMAAAKTFATWLVHEGRIESAPAGLMRSAPFNEKEDRRLVRRALTRPELDRLLAAAEAGPPIEAARGPGTARKNLDPAGSISGPQRALLYRLAMGTGFRANELRSLTPESFRLDGPEPEVVLAARDEKNRKGTVQPITRELADQLRPAVSAATPGRPFVAVPVRTAKMLRKDLAAAGISYKTESGVVDFHALRGSYITHLIMAGVNPKIVQKLARHSTITLTLDRYTTVENADLRKALEGEG